MFASRLAGCAPLPVVQVALGHQRLSSTQVYTHTSPAQLVAGLERLAGGWPVLPLRRAVCSRI